MKILENPESCTAATFRLPQTRFYGTKIMDIIIEKDSFTVLEG